jgi:hypothetical protein
MRAFDVRLKSATLTAILPTNIAHDAVPTTDCPSFSTCHLPSPLSKLVASVSDFLTVEFLPATASRTNRPEFLLVYAPGGSLSLNRGKSNNEENR